MARKVFISFLGTSNYLNCYYSFGNDDKSQPVRFVQEALITHICKDWEETDIILVFCTSEEMTKEKGSKELNWFDNGQLNATEEIEKIGLKHRLDDLKESNIIKAQIEEVDIPAGISEQEIWRIFDIVYQKLQQSDEIYFDVTHAFRSIPMFSVVLFNYSRFMKSTSLHSIFYGAFEKLGNYREVKAMPLEKRIAPIINLTDIALLQEYNQIASELRNYGKVKALSNLMMQTDANPYALPLKELAISLSLLDEYISTINLNGLKSGNYVASFINSFKHLKRKKVLAKPIENILDELNSLISEFENKDSFKNIEASIKWTIKYDMLMQTYPLAAEYIIMRVAEYYKTLKPKKLPNKKYREFIGSILGTPDDDFEIKNWKGLVAGYPYEADVLSDEPFINEIRPKYDIIRLYRNSLAHGNGSNELIEMKNNVGIIDECIKIIEKQPAAWEQKKRNVFINLSNHPSSEWLDIQLAEARRYGIIIDLPFPAIDETTDEAGIEALTDNYLAQIKELSGGKPCTVHIMGEMTFTYVMVNKLKDAGYACVASTSKRDVEILPDGSKQVRFNFCRFRKY